jgi:hypothetical protein
MAATFSSPSPVASFVTTAGSSAARAGSATARRRQSTTRHEAGDFTFSLR